MAKKKFDRDQLDILMADVNAKEGEGSLRRMNDADVVLERVTTGSKEVDAIIGGGLPVGRLIELFGRNSAGKTSFVYKMASNFEYVVFYDLEETFEPAMAAMHGLTNDKLLVRAPDPEKSAEQLIDEFIELAKSGCPLIVIDSLPMLQTRAALDIKPGDEKTAFAAGLAGILAKKAPKLAKECAKNGCTVIILNQVRQKIGGMGYGDPFDTPGGETIKHLYSLRMKIHRKGWLKVSDGKYGIVSALKVQKSKVSPPEGVVDLNLVWSKGWIEPADLTAVLKEARKVDIAGRKAAVAKEEARLAKLEEKLKKPKREKKTDE